MIAEEILCSKCGKKTTYLCAAERFENNGEIVEIVECLECGNKFANIYKFDRHVDLSDVLSSTPKVR